jgi:hypothetical protein
MPVAIVTGRTRRMDGMKVVNDRGWSSFAGFP